jgi:hypothetical protein
MAVTHHFSIAESPVRVVLETLHHSAQHILHCSALQQGQRGIGATKTKKKKKT